MLVGGLCFDHRERKVAAVAQKIIDALGALADETLADRDDASISDRALLGDGVRIVVPACRLQQGDDEFSAGIGFRRRHDAGALSYLGARGTRSTPCRAGYRPGF